MNPAIKTFLLRTLKRHAVVTETALIELAKGAFLDTDASEVRDNLAALDDGGLVVSSRVPVLETRQYGLTAAGTSAAATLR